MKIVHIAPVAPYNEYWGYQDNLLPKYQKRLGHDVTVIITNTMHRDGKIVETDCTDQILEDGVRVIRLPKKQYCHRVLTNLNSKLPVWSYLKKIKPDFIFYHSLEGTTIFDVIRYVKEINPKCIVVQDNHMDYNNLHRSGKYKDLIIRSFRRYINRRSNPYISRVYGVTPWRKTYAEDYYGIPSEKTDVLIMGADDEKIDFRNRENIRRKIRTENGVDDKEFLIVTGGKIDKEKKIQYLMSACSGMDGVKLLIFGQVGQDIKEEFDRLFSKNANIIYVGWVASDHVYDYFFAADLVLFPGSHSVLWEQACASKVPCVFGKWDGMEHVNNGGNSDFVSPITEETLKNKIVELKYTKKYERMRQIAMSEATDIYLYSKIAEKSLECVKKRE